MMVESSADGTDVKLTNVDNAISGSGLIVDAHLSLDNQAKGTINATGPDLLSIDVGSFTNEGKLEATGAGGLVFSTTIANSSTGLVATLAAGAHIELDHARPRRRLRFDCQGIDSRGDRRLWQSDHRQSHQRRNDQRPRRRSDDFARLRQYRHTRRQQQQSETRGCGDRDRKRDHRRRRLDRVRSGIVDVECHLRDRRNGHARSGSLPDIQGHDQWLCVRADRRQQCVLKLLCFRRQHDRQWLVPDGD